MTDDEFAVTQLSRDSAAELAFWGALAGEAFTVHEDAPPKVHDLAERTSQFGEAIIRFAKKIPWGPVNNRLIDQLVGAGTSVGANYGEADDGISRADFKHRIGICRKEARETKYLLRMIATAEPGMKDEARELWKRGPRTASDLLPNLAKHQDMSRAGMFVIRHLSFVIYQR